MNRVVDASVACKWFFEEDLSAEARALADARHVFIAPDLIIAECANVAWRRVRDGQVSLKQAEASLGALPAWSESLTSSAQLHEAAFRIGPGSGSARARASCQRPRHSRWGRSACVGLLGLCPAVSVFAAARGGGAWELPLDGEGHAPRRIGVSSVVDSTDAVFCESAVSMHSDRGGHAGIAQRLGVTAAPVRMDSQCKYGAIARGDASIYLRLPSSATYREKIWDHAAGFIVVTEAGGTVTDAYGRELDFSLGRTLERNRGVVATNGLLHRKVLAAATTVLPKAPAA